MTPKAPKAPRIVVVGSVNLDMRVHVDELPEPGATVLGTGFATGPGGKGANQAVAAARLGGDVRFVGSVGSDAAGAELRAALMADGVATDGLSITPGPSGMAIIEVDAEGQNRIVVIAGANQAVTPGSLGEDSVKGADVVLLQLEVPRATVVRAAALARHAGARVVLNAAPAMPLSEAELADVDLLVVNETEAAAMLDGRNGRIGAADRADLSLEPSHAAAALTTLVPAVIITLGSEGAVWAERGAAGWPVRHSALRAGSQPAFPARAIDTTGAGDTFVGALGVRLGAGDDLPAAIRYASAAAAIATTREGAQESAPRAAEVEALLAARGDDDAA